jgi:hypothetical protein
MVKTSQSASDFGLAWRLSDPGALRRPSWHGWAAAPLICQPNRGKNLKMPKMPKSVQFRPEAYDQFLAFLEPRSAFEETGLDFSRGSHGSRSKKFSCAPVKSCLRQQSSRLP